MRPVGRPSHKPVVAASWATARRVVAKWSFMAESCSRGTGFIVTNLEIPNRAVVRF